jgi:ABC-type transporter Mla MlaB component
MKEYELKTIQKDSDLTMVLKGNLTLQNIKKIGKDIQNNLQKNKNIRLKIEEVESIDLSMIQLIYVSKQAAIKDAKKFSVSMSLPDELASLISVNGFSQLLKEQ